MRAKRQHALLERLVLKVSYLLLFIGAESKSANRGERFLVYALMRPTASCIVNGDPSAFIDISF